MSDRLFYVNAMTNDGRFAVAPIATALKWPRVADVSRAIRDLRNLDPELGRFELTGPFLLPEEAKDAHLRPKM